MRDDDDDEVSLAWVDSLRPHAACPKVGELPESYLRQIWTYGVKLPIHITEAGEVVVGVRRWTAARRLGVTDVPVRVIREEDQAPGYVEFAARHLNGEPGVNGE